MATTRQQQGASEAQTQTVAPTLKGSFARRVSGDTRQAPVARQRQQAPEPAPDTQAMPQLSRRRWNTPTAAADTQEEARPAARKQPAPRPSPNARTVSDPKALSELNLRSQRVTQVELNPDLLTADGRLLIDLGIDCTASRDEDAQQIARSMEQVFRLLNLELGNKIPGGIKVAVRVTRFDGNGVHAPHTVPLEQLGTYVARLPYVSGLTRWGQLLDTLGTQSEPSAAILLSGDVIENSRSHGPQTPDWHYPVSMSMHNLITRLQNGRAAPAPTYLLHDRSDYAIAALASEVKHAMYEHPKQFGGAFERDGHGSLSGYRKMIDQIVQQAVSSAKVEGPAEKRGWFR